MSTIDLEALLAEISAEQPCGEDLEYDPAFRALEGDAAGRPEQQMGATVIAAEVPDWRRVRGGALALFERTRDLRVAVHLTRALLNTGRLEGLRDGLALLHGLLERWWDPVHPQLDPEDDHDPTIRVNVVASIGDAATTLSEIRTAALVRSPGFGDVSLRDVLVASGELTPAAGAGGEAPDSAAIRAAFLEADPSELATTQRAAHESAELVSAIEALLTERLGSDSAPDLTAATDLLERCSSTVAEYVGSSAGEEDGAAQPQADVAAAVPSAPRPSASIDSRDDVLATLDRIIGYYERHEPASPIPLLLVRSKRLVTMSFLEVLAELAPEGLSQAHGALGTNAEGD